MKTIQSKEYIEARDREGNMYYCPISSVSNPEDLTEQETEICVEKDVTERYAGMIQ